MASDALRMKIQYRKEETEASRLPSSLPNFHTFGYLQDADIPDWVTAKLGQWSLTSTSPHARITDEDESRANAWIEKFTQDSGIESRFYCRTGMKFFPWLDCEVSRPGWAKTIRAALGGDLTLISHDKLSMAAIFEEEYEFLGFSYSVQP